MGWEVEVPKAGMFLWVKIPEPYSQMGSIKFSIEMMNRANVALAPGAGFGEEGDGYLRLALWKMKTGSPRLLNRCGAP
jgi:alanine-synthesizing transaminase